jgi:hypothetical protein
MDHEMGVNDALWKWGQEKSGMINPSTFFRNILMEAMRIDAPVMQASSEDAAVRMYERLSALGLADIKAEMDPDAASALAWGIKACGTVGELCTYLEMKDLNNPRAWLIAQWRKQQGG